MTRGRLVLLTWGCGLRNVAAFPSNVNKMTQYGPRAKGFAVYLMSQHYLPYERTAQMFSDLFGHSLSEGSLENFQQNMFEDLFQSEQIIKEDLLSAKVAGFDETGCKVNKKLHWIHSASTATETLYGIHPRRGNEAMNDIGVLPHFSGIGVHDGWASYQEYGFSHSLCNAHHLRELTHIGEQLGEGWALKMKRYLKKMKARVDKAREKGGVHPVPAEGGKGKPGPLYQGCDQAYRVGLEGEPPGDHESGRKLHGPGGHPTGKTDHRRVGQGSVRPGLSCRPYHPLTSGLFQTWEGPFCVG